MEIKTVTVIGANGTMGCNISGIFASFGNAKVYMACRSLEKAEKAVSRAAKSVRAEAIAENLVPATFDDLPSCVSESDLIFESVSENFETKEDIIARIADYVRPEAILATGTSGLSIDKLAEMYPENLRPRFLGMHFFNPPYMMTLCEIIQSEYTDKEMAAELMDYAKHKLVRTVVNVADTAAFLGNRIGFQFINEACQYAEMYKDNGGIDYIDAILGQFTGRNMPPIATADFVGLDVHKAIVDNVYANTKDYARSTFILPEYMQKLIDEGKLGRKVKQGLYKTVVDESGKKTQYVYDIDSGEYREKIRYNFPFAKKMIDFLHQGDYKQACL
ncbi:MAG: 3-hydroxyacyl-CoA dehydrogenase family protein [Butyricicoccus sp.]